MSAVFGANDVFEVLIVVQIGTYSVNEMGEEGECGLSVYCSSCTVLLLCVVKSDVLSTILRFFIHATKINRPTTYIYSLVSINVLLCW